MPPRFFCPVPLASGAVIELPEPVAHHAVHVLRLRSGDEVVLFDGAGGEYPARLDGSGRKMCAVLGPWRAAERESPLDLTLVQALPAGEKMDWVVQKAVELGAARIAPVVSARSVVRLAGERARRREEHWRQVMIAACEQCGRNRLPQLAPLADLADFLALAASQREAARLLLAPGGDQSLRDIRPGMPVVLLVGPEGGFTENEEAAALAAGFRRLSLGPRVLRTETAGLAALAALAALFGDFR
ncbi:MAG: 16S rRNA (uracil(1498)-N(3))-methyltransferase [Pseudomonadota bacterium]